MTAAPLSNPHPVRSEARTTLACTRTDGAVSARPAPRRGSGLSRGRPGKVEHPQKSSPARGPWRAVRWTIASPRAGHGGALIGDGADSSSASRRARCR